MYNIGNNFVNWTYCFQKNMIRWNAVQNLTHSSTLFQNYFQNYSPVLNDEENLSQFHVCILFLPFHFYILWFQNKATTLITGKCQFWKKVLFWIKNNFFHSSPIKQFIWALHDDDDVICEVISPKSERWYCCLAWFVSAQQGPGSKQSGDKRKCKR